MSDVDIAQLALRLQRVEDELAIHAVLTRYGLAVDSDCPDAVEQLYSADTLIDIDGRVFMRGNIEARQMVESAAHQAILPTCAHVMGPFVVEIEGTTATATGYATVYAREDGRQQVWRQSFGRIELEKREGHWQITRRTSRAVGHPEAFALVRPALAMAESGTR